MVEAYWLAGERIVLEDQNGKARANYGEQVIKKVSKDLTKELGKGYSERSIRQYRQFYLMYPKLGIERVVLPETKTTNRPKEPIRRTLFAKSKIAWWNLIAWSHIQRIMRVLDPHARSYYVKESIENSWSFRTLDRNISTQYYERLLLSQLKKPVIKEMKRKTKKFQNDKLEFIKNPSVLEFLGLPDNSGYTESVLEKAIIDHLQQFLLELGKGFSFIGRQQLVRTEAADYFIDLVFYNYILKCFVLIDLKTAKITHQDVGQMDMYVRMYDELKRNRDDNPTIGIVLCTETDEDIARYSILKGNEQLFATRYKLYLPTEKQLKKEIEQEKEIIRIQLEELSD
jgi:predicted nuclease of restriction endonuclease-like (RecB) superfamily